MKRLFPALIKIKKYDGYYWFFHTEKDGIFFDSIENAIAWQKNCLCEIDTEVIWPTGFLHYREFGLCDKPEILLEEIPK